MLREVDLDKITDGKRYTAEDMVRMGCNDCKNCHLCCSGMGNSIILDPYDVYNMTKATGKGVNELLVDTLELNVVDGIIVPNIKMRDESDRCAFLNKEGRCSIHNERPGFCRLFPLGRIYEEEGFSYIHQIHECPYPDKTKVKIKKWLEYDNIKDYEAYILTWHGFCKDMQSFINESKDEGAIKTLNMLILKSFFLDEYDIENDFYSQFEIRMENINKILGLG